MNAHIHPVARPVSASATDDTPTAGEPAAGGSERLEIAWLASGYNGRSGNWIIRAGDGPRLAVYNSDGISPPFDCGRDSGGDEFSFLGDGEVQGCRDERIVVLVAEHDNPLGLKLGSGPSVAPCTFHEVVLLRDSGKLGSPDDSALNRAEDRSSVPGRARHHAVPWPRRCAREFQDQGAGRDSGSVFPRPGHSGRILILLAAVSWRLASLLARTRRWFSWILSSPAVHELVASSAVMRRQIWPMASGGSSQPP